MTTPLHPVRLLGQAIRFEHTVFALPFALMGMMLAAGGWPAWRVVGWILVAMVGARSAAMAFNRIADLPFDRRNPRTQRWVVPSGKVSVAALWAVVIGGSGLLVLAAWQLNPLALRLSPVVLFVLLTYSLSKRFTVLSHLWLGSALGIAPAAAWVAVRGDLAWPPVVLAAAVTLWTAGFDIIYSCQDIAFDRQAGLKSLPARLGAGPALWASRACHAGMVALLVVLAVQMSLQMFYAAGVAATGALLLWEHSLVKPNDFSRVNAAFFTANGLVSALLFLCTAADILF